DALPIWATPKVTVGQSRVNPSVLDRAVAQTVSRIPDTTRTNHAMACLPERVVSNARRLVLTGYSALVRGNGVAPVPIRDGSNRPRPAPGSPRPVPEGARGIRPLQRSSASSGFPPGRRSSSPGAAAAPGARSMHQDGRPRAPGSRTQKDDNEPPHRRRRAADRERRGGIPAAAAFAPDREAPQGGAHRRRRRGPGHDPAAGLLRGPHPRVLRRPARRHAHRRARPGPPARDGDRLQQALPLPAVPSRGEPPLLSRRCPAAPLSDQVLSHFLRPDPAIHAYRS